MFPFEFVLGLVLVAVPPLTEGESARLAAAVDGRDERDEAFEALLDNVRRWTPGVAAAAVRLRPDLEGMLADPGAYRGALCRLTGTIRQQTTLPPPHDSVAEWFIRDDAGRPILLYMHGPAARQGFNNGQPVVVLARFYKRVDATAVDGRLHRYPAFVGAFPQRVRTGDATWARLWAVTLPVAVMLGVFLLLLVYARRGQGPMRARVRPADQRSEAEEEPLPAEAAEALAELRRRAEAGP